MKQRIARKRARGKDRIIPCHIHKKYYRKPRRIYVLFDDLRNVYLNWCPYSKHSCLPLLKVKEMTFKLAPSEEGSSKTENIYEINNLIENIGHTGMWRPIRIL